MTEELHVAPTRVGPNTYAEPTDEQRGALVAYLRGLAERIEHPSPADMPLRIGQINSQLNMHHPLTLQAFDPMRHTAIGQQVNIILGWGTPKFGWQWK